MKKLYISPEFEILMVKLSEEILTSSLENGGSQIIDDGSDWDSWGGDGSNSIDSNNW